MSAGAILSVTGIEYTHSESEREATVDYTSESGEESTLLSSRSRALTAEVTDEQAANLTEAAIKNGVIPADQATLLREGKVKAVFGELENMPIFQKALNEKFKGDLKAPAVLMSGTIQGFGFVIMDISYFARTVPQSLEPFGSSHVMPAMGLTSAFSIFLGPDGMRRNYQNFKNAAAVNDTKEKVVQLLSGIGNFGQFVGGLGMGAARGLYMAAIIENIKIAYNSTSLLGKVAFWFMAVGLGAILLFYAALGVAFIYNAIHRQLFISKLNSFKTEEEKVAFLQKRVQGDLKQFEAKYGITADEKYQEVAITQLKKAFKNLPEFKNTESREIEAKLKAFAAGENGEVLTLIGKEIEKVKSTIKKQNKLKRMVGDEIYKDVEALLATDAAKQALTSLQQVATETNRLLTDSADKKEAPKLDAFHKTIVNGLFDKMTAKVKSSRNLETLLVVAALAGLACLICAFFPFGAGILVTAATVVAALLFMAVDSLYLKQDYATTTVGKYDRITNFVMATLITIGIILAVTVTLVYGFPLLPLILVGIIGGSALAGNIWADYKIRQNIKANREQEETEAKKKLYTVEKLTLSKKLKAAQDEAASRLQMNIMAKAVGLFKEKEFERANKVCEASIKRNRDAIEELAS